MTKMLRLPDQAAADALQRKLTGHRGEVGAPVDAALERGVKGLRAPKQGRNWSEALLDQIRLAGLSPPEMEYRFSTERKFRLDLAWPARALGVEVDGAVHRIRDKWERDVERHNFILDSGWRVYRVTNAMVRSGAALALVERVLRTGTPET